MIEIFEGRLGAGKSYFATKRILDHLAAGGTVSTNVELLWPGCVEYCRKHFAVEIEETQLVNLWKRDVSDFHKLTPAGTDDLNTLVVLDEAQLDFNARDWSHTSKDLLAFLTQSRKQNTDVIFITQHSANVDKQFVRLVQFVWCFRDMERFTLPGLGISWTTLARVASFGTDSGKYILACCYDYDGRTLYSRQWESKSPEIFRCYQTKSLVRSFDRAGVAARKSLQKVKSHSKNNPMKVLLVFVAIAGVLLWQFSSRAKAKSSPPASVSSPGLLSRSMGTPAPARGRFEVYGERFMAFYGGDATLHTDAGWYSLGEMSSKGYVVAVSDRRAKLELPDGRTGWIVAEDWGYATFQPGRNEDSEPKPAATPAPEKSTPVQLAQSGLAAEGDDTLERVRAGLPPRKSVATTPAAPSTPTPALRQRQARYGLGGR